MYGLDDPILVIQTCTMHRDTPDRLIIPPTPHDIGIKAAIRVRQLDVPLAQALSPPPPITASDPLLALTAKVTVMIDAMVSSAATGSEASVRTGKLEAIFGGFGAHHRGFKGAEAKDARDQGPKVGHVGDDDGGGRFTGIPVEVDQGAVAGGEVVVAIQDGAEDDEGTEGEDGEEDDLSRADVSEGELKRGR